MRSRGEFLFSTPQPRYQSRNIVKLAKWFFCDNMDCKQCCGAGPVFNCSGTSFLFCRLRLLINKKSRLWVLPNFWQHPHPPKLEKIHLFLRTRFLIWLFNQCWNEGTELRSEFFLLLLSWSRNWTFKPAPAKMFRLRNTGCKLGGCACVCSLCLSEMVSSSSPRVFTGFCWLGNSCQQGRLHTQN